MKQITEDYVSFETAKLLKEKGFDCGCTGLYYENKKFDISLGLYSNSELEKHDIKGMISAPTHQMVLKWLREVHNIHIIPYFDKIQPSDLPYSFVVYIVDEYTATREIIACFDIDENLYWSKQEQAVEAAILYVLKNLI